ncbi:MAG: hypothetical protein QXS03_02700 [Candidatus Micrarchaeaceae archaeon]
MLLSDGTEEYLMTAGILIAFITMVASLFLERKSVLHIFSSFGVKKKDALIAVGIALLFIALEIAIVQPTQQLFFDDVIYQGGAQDLLHLGQAWMCNYGTPTQCFSGEIYHEPIGTAFLLAIGFLFFGIARYVAYYEFIALAAISVFMAFAVGVLLFKSKLAGFFSELLMALSPAVLVWAAPTTSDLPTMLFSLVAVFSLLVFLYKKSFASFSFMLFSFAFVAYMKVDAFLLLIMLPFLYMLLYPSGIIASIKYAFSRLKKNFLDPKFLSIILLFLLALLPELIYVVQQQSVSGNYGDQGVQIWTTCNLPGTAPQPVKVSGNINMQNFNANICGNLEFWGNAYANVYIMQPLSFTIFAFIGAAFLAIMKRKKALLAILIWFFGFFLLYSAFYAGSVLYGVDWRFQLSMIPQASLLGGFGAAEIVEIFKSKIKKGNTLLFATIAIIAIAVLFFSSTLQLYGQLSIPASSIPQAMGARFYENFVYANSIYIPSNCLVFTFDPTLFNINGRAADQFSNLSEISTPAGYANFSNTWQCMAIDYGYWCESTTASEKNYCDYEMAQFNTSLITQATISNSKLNATYSIYKINGLR